MERALQQRIATGVILVAGFVALVLFAPPIVLKLVFTVAVLLGAREWAAMGRLHGFAGWLYAVAVAAVALAAERHTLAREFIIFVGLGFWLVALVWIVSYQLREYVPSWLRTGPVHLLVGWVILVPAWLAVLRLQPALLLVLFAVIWAGDSGAYFCGRAWGKRKLIPRVSPGKTWVGLAGAVLVAAPVGFAVAALGGVLVGPGSGFVILCVLTVGVSVVGDLTESLFKRMAGVKDSGTLLPGHGGVLDRIDSLTAAAPFFVVGLHTLRELS